MNKKEEIKYLKSKLRYYKASAFLATKALEPYKIMATQRGARMQIMHKYIENTLVYHKEFNDWFDKDGNPK